MQLALTHQNNKITTIEGLSEGEKLHPLQAAFIKHDAFQCGYCTSGQIMSAVTCVREGNAKSRASIQAYMDTNICRCGAYQNIVDAIAEVAKTGVKI
jgi:xanthine dehydrogenase YagT iron-sulfur-binding subunit